MSFFNSDMLTFFIFLYCIVFLINDGFGSEILFMIEMWSEMQKSGFGVSCKISSPILVIIRSNVWPCVWVASWTCCSKPRDPKRSRNFKASSFEGLSTCTLKSPFIRTGCGHNMTYSKYSISSLKNVPIETGWVLEYGGLYIIISLNIIDPKGQIFHSEYSKEFNIAADTFSTGIFSW